MRIVFIGAVQFSESALEHLLARGADVVGVCTLAHSRVNADHRDLGLVCAAHGVPWTYTPDVNSDESVAWIADKRPDVVFCFGWSALLKERLLTLAPLGVIGYHPAALPANRGRHPIIWALVLGLKETASTFFVMDAGADSGDILSQERVSIGDEDDAGSLYRRLTDVALAQIDEFVPRLASGTCPRRPQDARLANSWRKRGRADGQIDWRMSARSIRNLVRGLSRPYPGAHFLHHGSDVRVWKAAVVLDVPGNAEPGKVLAVGPHGVTVKCGEGGVRLEDVEPRVTILRGEYL